MTRFILLWALRYWMVWLRPSYVFTLLRQERCYYRVDYPNDEGQVLMVSMGNPECGYAMQNREFRSFRHAAREMTATLWLLVAESRASRNWLLMRWSRERAQ